MQRLDSRRLAAWRVAQLSRRDRSWLLRRLPPELRKILEGQLTELKRSKLAKRSLGFEEVMDALEQEEDRDVALTGTRYPDADIDLCQELERMVRSRAPGELAVLDRFPPWFLALLIQEVPYVQRRYIEQCDNSRRELIAQLVVAIKKPVPPALLREVAQLAINALRQTAQ